MKIFTWIWLIAMLTTAAYQAIHGTVSQTIFWCTLAILSDKNFKEAK